MGRDPDQPTPDLFSTKSDEDASSSSIKTVAAKPEADTASRRHVLPKNLRHAVGQLSDAELDELFEAAFDEVKRRGRLPHSVAAAYQRPSELLTKTWPATHKFTRRQADITEVTLTRGQVNAVRAAFKAGITPSRIARQFGISQSNVRKALAGDE
jgi:hypothetical protein